MQLAHSKQVPGLPQTNSIGKVLIHFIPRYSMTDSGSDILLLVKLITDLYIYMYMYMYLYIIYICICICICICIYILFIFVC